jgi:flagellar biosynthesis chaperone FliJ
MREILNEIKLNEAYKNSNLRETKDMDFLTNQKSSF